MNTINMPGFTADISLYKTSGRHQSVTTYSYSSGEQRVVSQIRVDSGFGGVGGLGAGLSAGSKRGGLGFISICTGDSDCNDMFSKNCGPNAVCFISGSQVICICW